MDSTDWLWTHTKIKRLWKFFLSHYRLPRTSRIGGDHHFGNDVQETGETGNIFGGVDTLVICCGNLAWALLFGLFKIMKILVLIFNFLYSSQAWACAGCYSTNGGSVSAFRWSVLLLTFVPLIFISSFILWCRHKLKKHPF